MGNGEENITYISAGSYFDALDKIVPRSDSIIVGAHGASYDKSFAYPVNRDKTERVFYASYDIYCSSGIDHTDIDVYLPPWEDKKCEFSFVLH